MVAHLHEALESERRARADVCEMELRVALSFADTTPMPSLSARDVVVCLRDCATWSVTTWADGVTRRCEQV